MLYSPGGDRRLHGRLFVAGVAAREKGEGRHARSRARRSRATGAAQSQASNQQRQTRQGEPAETTQTIAARNKERVSGRPGERRRRAKKSIAPRPKTPGLLLISKF